MPEKKSLLAGYQKSFLTMYTKTNKFVHSNYAIDQPIELLQHQQYHNWGQEYIYQSHPGARISDNRNVNISLLSTSDKV